MGNTHSRRDFIKLLSKGSLSLFTLSALGGCETLLQAIRNRPVRRDISGLSPTDPIIQTFEGAVKAMKALDPSDPRNWTAQAQIHFDHCPHGNWYFLPWHRAYLYHFEQICRQLTGNDDFALPYWNWTNDKQVPSVFWNTGSPLFNSTRTATSSSTASDTFVGLPVVESIQNETNFLLYASGQSTTQRGSSSYGRLEQRPHNYIHGFVGGDMGSFMSPLDPIFWTHHNMIDCLWADWNMNRNNPNTNDPQWTQFDFAGNFVDGNGDPVTTNVLSTVLMPLLSYRFENCIGDPTDEAERDTEAMRKFLREGAKVELDFIDRVRLQRGIRVVVNQPVGINFNLDRPAFRRVLNQEQEEKMLLTVGDVDLPEGNDFFVRVFVDMPEASSRTPLDDPHYAGSFAFFVDPEVQMNHEEQPDYHVDITDTLYRLWREGLINDNNLNEIGIQLVAVPFPDREIRAQTFGLNFLEMGIVRPLTEDNEE
jgi:tyrosinase